MLKVISFDPSGNHGSEKEGNGTTGIAIAIDGVVTELREVKAEDYKSTLDYWDSLYALIEQEHPDYVVIEGYKLYNHKGMSANTQANSTLMTSQLIGMLRMKCYHYEIPCTIQFASDVKTRWSDDILLRKGYLGNLFTFKGKRTNAHKRDALRHLVHFYKYKLKEELTV